MVVSNKKWKEIFNAAVRSSRNSTGSDILEQIKANLRKKDEGVYQEWAQKGFDMDHMFTWEDAPLCTTLLCIAVRGDHKDIVKTLLDKGASVNAKDSLEMAPLHWAVIDARGDMVRILLGKGADVDEEGSLGRTPLHFAAEKGHEGMVRILLDKGASVDEKDDRGRTPLHFAAGDGHENIVKALLDKGASVDEKDDRGRTPLQCAVAVSNERASRFLYWTFANGHERTSKSLIENEIKLRGLEVEKPECLQNPNTDLRTGMSKYWDECLEEIEKMQEKKIENITLYDILVSKGADKLVSYIRSRDVSDELEKVNYKNEFPIYGNGLERQYKIGKQRLDAFGVGEMGIKYFGGFTKNEMGQSSLKIAEYLSNEDIENLEKARIQAINESNHKPGESSKKAPRSFKTNVDVEHAAKKQESASRCIVS
ncbi:ankyrin repeat domain-containing protein [Wolbachia endosymbiont of Aedes albopictus]|uniref:ankyrin repeat domain-containing protein n=1 Tax=Wolbachia endosymbiont of Aedes albopictus TaxID=167957 RepID=UPI000BBBAA42|nr:ankyrin repeat domain-containing protein [Wolbachia endosymbiont of Aedes albopictus]UVW83823.1 ankyrin repeat domain-containing protein [Wolbachia endosymbiont of Aedes albopictus]